MRGHRCAAREEEAVSDYVLIYQGGSMPETEEAQKAVMDAWTAWFTSIGGAVKDPGNPFTPGAAKTIAADGAVSEGGLGAASGYTILSADSLDEAVTLAKDCPVLAGGASIAVHETFDVM
jgi:hypothetical protein